MMMMMEGTMSSVSKENVEVIDALVSNFALYDDVNKVYDIGKTYRKLDQVAKDKEEQIKQDIRELSKKVSRKTNKQTHLSCTCGQKTLLALPFCVRLNDSDRYFK